MRLSTTTAALLLALALADTADAGVVTIVPDKDNTLFSESGSTSNGAGDFLFSGRTALNARRRALVHFNVAAAIPAGATISSVQLLMTVSQTIAGPEPTQLRRVLADWGEGTSDAPNQEGTGTGATPGDATWTDRFFGVSQWVQVGGEFAPTSSATILVDQFTTHTWGPTQEMANDVQLWLNNPAQNFGWLVLGNESQSGSAKRFDSRTNPSGLGPVLIVDFTPPCTPASYCTATASSLGVPGVLTATNTPLISNGVFSLQATNVPPSTACTFYFGDLRSESPLGNGNLCVAGTLRRFGTVTSDNAGVATRNLVLNAPPGTVITPFSTWCFQVQYRDPIAAGFNQTQALAVTFCP